MNNIEIVTSIEYKKCLEENIEFDNLIFFKNPEKEKESFYQDCNHKEVFKYNEIIKNSYLFMKDEHAHYFLLLNPESNIYEGAVFKIDSSGVIDIIGTNIFNYLTDEEKIEIEIYGIETEKLIKDFKDNFKEKDFNLKYEDIDKISENLDNFYL